MDKFKQLESFVSVATLGSLSAAARAEGIAPAMMGRRLTALEARLGVKLLVRSTRRSTLTAEGSMFLEEAQRILRELADAEHRIAQHGGEPTGHLRLTAPAGFGRRHVAPLIPGFLQRFPKVSITLDLTDRLVNLIDERYDCAVRIGELDDSQYIGVRLADNKRVIVAAPSYIKEHGRPTTPDDLAQHNCLSFGSQGNQAKGWLLRDQDTIRPVRVRGNMASSDGSVLHEWTLAGCGLAWRSLWEVQEDLQAGRLVTVLDDYAAPANGIFAMLPQRQHLPRRVRAFVELLRDTYGKDSYWAPHRTKRSA